MRKVAFLVFLLTLPGLCKVRLGNAPASFHRPHPLMVAGERAVAAAAGFGETGFAVTKAPTLEEALAAEEEKGVKGLSAVVPSRKRQGENFALVAKLASPAIDAADFCPVAVDNVPFPVKNMYIETDDGVILLAPGGDDFDPQRTLKELFDGFARETYILLGISLLVLLAALGVMRSLKLLMPAGMAVASTMGVLGYLGATVNFFQLLVFFIIVGLGLDYAIFHQSGKADRKVLASFLTSLVGLGMLSFTSFEVTRSMGITLALGLTFAYGYSRYVVRAA